MNIQLFKNKKYQEIIKKHAVRIDFGINKAFYYSNYDFDDELYQTIIEQTPIITEISFFCYLDQSWFGYMLIENKYYIIEVDDECMVRIVADNEVGWLEGPLWCYDDREERLRALQLEMNKKFHTSLESNNYDEFQEVENRYPEWFN